MRHLAGHHGQHRDPEDPADQPSDPEPGPVGHLPVRRPLDAAEELEKEGLDVEVIDLRTLAPLDRAGILASVKKTNKAILLHEASRTGGIGGEMAAILAEEAFEWLDAPVIRIASIDTPVPYSPPLEDYYLPQIKDVVDAARKLAAY